MSDFSGWQQWLPIVLPLLLIELALLAMAWPLARTLARRSWTLYRGFGATCRGRLSKVRASCPWVLPPTSAGRWL